VRCFTGDVVNGKAVYNPDGKTLFIDYELYSAGVEIDKTPEFYDGLVPSAPMWPRKWPIRADSSRPETISYMQRHGYPLLVRANKGPNSVVEGVAFLQDYDIVVHPRCKYTVDEFRFYSYKVDKKTLKVTRELVDDKNHIIDGVRYAIEPLLRTPRWAQQHLGCLGVSAGR
jgi:phage terminase large subunit